MRFPAAIAPLLALGLVSCAPAPAPLLAPVSAHARAPAPRARTTRAPPELDDVTAPRTIPAQPSVPLPPWMTRPSEVACSWGTDAWRPVENLTELRLRPKGAVFALISSGRAHLQIPVGARMDGRLDIASSGLALTGVVEPAAIQLFAAREIAMNGAVFPASTTPLSYVEGSSDRVSVTMDTPEGVIVNKPPLRATRPCNEVSLDPGATLDPAKVTLGASNGSFNTVRGKRALDVFSDPGRPPVLRLVSAEGTLVESFATAGGFSRVGVAVQSAFIAGWVRTDRLEPQDGGGSGLYGIGGLGFGSSSSGLHALMSVACSGDVPVVAEADGERATVGLIRAQTSIHLVTTYGAFWEVYIKSTGIRMVDTGVLMVRAADLTGCRVIDGGHSIHY